MHYRLTIENLRKVNRHEAYFADSSRTVSLSSFASIRGDGFFEEPFSKNPGGYPKRGFSTAQVFIYSEDTDKGEEAAHRNINIHHLDSYDKVFPSLSVSFDCSPDLLTMIEGAVLNGGVVDIQFEVQHWEVDEEARGEEFSFVTARISRVDVRTTTDTFRFEDFLVRDIKTHLMAKNCLGYQTGQVSEICSELAESFRNISPAIDKNGLLDDVTSLIASCRYYLHDALDAADQFKLDTLKKKYDFTLSSHPEYWTMEFEKITDSKDRAMASSIFNCLWTTKNAAAMISNGNHFPVGSDVAGSIADQYLALRYLRSETLERLLVDMLVCATAEERATELSQNRQLSAGTRAAVFSSFYDKQRNSSLHNLGVSQAVFAVIVFIAVRLTVTLLHGLFLWWLSGIISGDNHTAHVVLFGSLFSASVITTYLHSRSEGVLTQVPPKYDEKSFYVLRDLCNLQSMVGVYRSNSFRTLLDKCVSDGARFPSSLHRILG